VCVCGERKVARISKILFHRERERKLELIAIKVTQKLGHGGGWEEMKCFSGRDDRKVHLKLREMIMAACVV